MPPLNDIERALARINRGIQLAIDSKEEVVIKDLTVTKEALEKQIPKKVTYKGFHYQCNKCGSYMDGDIGKYCADCGQAISWEE